MAPQCPYQQGMTVTILTDHKNRNDNKDSHNDHDDHKQHDSHDDQDRHKDNEYHNELNDFNHYKLSFLRELGLLNELCWWWEL